MKNRILPALRLLFTLFLAMFALFGCFRKKDSRPRNIKAWIAANFPDDLEVKMNNWNWDIVDMFKGKKVAVIGDKKDEAVQFTLAWQKPASDSAEVVLDPAAVRQTWEKCKQEAARARELHAALKAQGMEQFSVGVIDQAAYILPFAEPTPENRLKIAQQVLAALDAEAQHPQTSIWIEMMEPAVYEAEFKDVIPNAHWQRPGTWQHENKILSLDFEWQPNMNAKKLANGWEFNADSRRTTPYIDISFKVAEAWAQKNLAKPWYMDPYKMVSMDQGNDPLSIRFRFPYFSSKPANDDLGDPTGFIVGVFHLDSQTFDQIKKEKY